MVKGKGGSSNSNSSTTKSSSPPSTKPTFKGNNGGNPNSYTGRPSLPTPFSFGNLPVK